MHFGRRQRVRFVLVIGILGVLGLASTYYLLREQRFPDPLRDTYTVEAKFTEADGVVAGLGQPVNVSGVKVGTITAADHDNAGNAVVTLEIHRDELPRVRSDATVSLEPITPLKDMQIALDPGTTKAPVLADGATISTARTASPVPLAELLASLDADTRAFLGSLIASVDQGTRGQGQDMRKAFRALGPTVAQVGDISRALDGRRKELARLVHNLARVTRAASRDDELATVVTAGDATLESIARQEAPLRESLARLPDTLDVTRSTLRNVGSFSRKLGPTLTELLPAVRRLPDTMEQLEPFAREGTTALRDQIRPLVREARPTVGALAPAIPQLTRALPDLYDTAQSLRYLMNVSAYNPTTKAFGQEDEGNLFWLSWFIHNMSSTFSGGEAHGGTARASVVVNCNQIAHLLDYGALLKLITGTSNLCPG